jgi:hypothetical protein
MARCFRSKALPSTGFLRLGQLSRIATVHRFDPNKRLSVGERPKRTERLEIRCRRKDSSVELMVRDAGFELLNVNCLDLTPFPLFDWSKFITQSNRSRFSSTLPKIANSNG